MNRKGILAAGNFIVDHVKIIDVFPSQDSLCNILSQSSSNGGGAYNVLKNTAKLHSEIPLEAIGLIGDDANGQFIINDCSNYNIDTKFLIKTSESTSYTDVMSVKTGGRRTFFHQRGANSKLDAQHFKIENSNAKIFYLGYMMLLDELDKIQANQRTKASEIFEKAQKLGFITVSDLVSENSGKFKETVASSLPYIDYLFINEFEAAKITGCVTTNSSGEVDVEACKKACQSLLQLGVNQWVVLHFPKGAIAISKNGECISQPSLNIPKELIKGTTGAGDAFATGCIVGIHEEWEMKKSLELAVSAAAACLFESTCSDGLMSVEDCLSLNSKF